MSSMSRLSDGTIEWHSTACVDYVMGLFEIFGRVDCENLWAFFVCVVVGDLASNLFLVIPGNT